MFTLEQLLIWLSLGLLAVNVIAIGGMVLRAGFGHVRTGRFGEMRVRALQLAAANLAAPALVWTALRDDAVLEKRLAAAGWEVWPDLQILALPSCARHFAIGSFRPFVKKDSGSALPCVVHACDIPRAATGHWARMTVQIGRAHV